MRIQRTSQFVTAGIVVLSALAIACTLVSRRMRSVEAEAYDTRRRMFNLTQQLAFGSDRLTAEVRAYAATGDRKHYEAFQREVNVDRNRDVAVEGLRQLDLEPDELELLATVSALVLSAAVPVASARGVCLDLGKLSYMSSMGLRVVMKLMKDLRSRNAVFQTVHVQPQIKKVFDIAAALPPETVFKSIEEADAYLDLMQKKVLRGDS